MARVLKERFWNIVGRERKLWWKVKYWGEEVWLGKRLPGEVCIEINFYRY